MQSISRPRPPPSYDPTTGANYGAKPNTGFQDADFFLGAASAYGQRLNAPFGHSHLREFGFYIQDNFRVNSRLTINAGLRWEMHPAPKVKDDNYVTFDMKNAAIVLSKDPSAYVENGFTTQAILTNLKNLGAKFETPQQAGLPAAGFYNSMANFMPRLGFAYTPGFSKWGTVIRGGYGEYIYPVPIRNSVRYLTAAYPFTAGYSQSYTSASQSPDAYPTVFSASRRPVIAGLNSANVVDTNSITALLPGVSSNVSFPEYAPARVRDANMTSSNLSVMGRSSALAMSTRTESNLDQNYQYNTLRPPMCGKWPRERRRRPAH